MVSVECLLYPGITRLQRYTSPSQRAPSAMRDDTNTQPYYNVVKAIMKLCLGYCENTEGGYLTQQEAGVRASFQEEEMPRIGTFL